MASVPVLFRDAHTYVCIGTNRGTFHLRQDWVAVVVWVIANREVVRRSTKPNEASHNLTLTLP